MRPAETFGETREEAAGGDRAGIFAADIGDIGVTGFELALVVVPQRQAPGAIERRLARGDELIGERIVLAHQAGRVFAECDDAGAGQGRGIDDHLRFILLHISQCIAEDQTPFGVGIEHLDRLSRHRRDHIAGPLCIAAGHIFDRGHDADQIELELQLDRGEERAEHAGRTAHVEFHFLHARAGLDRNAAGVEGDALADQRVGFVALTRPPPLQRDQARFVRRALGDAEQGAHAELAHVVLVEHFTADAGVVQGELPRLVGEIGWCADVRRQIAEFARVAHAIGDCRGLAQNGSLGVRRRGERDRAELRCLDLLC